MRESVPKVDEATHYSVVRTGAADSMRLVFSWGGPAEEAGVRMSAPCIYLQSWSQGASRQEWDMSKEGKQRLIAGQDVKTCRYA
jgi:hypothetical protein